ncbi:hypothetical protein KIN20_028499 [Parelaphostrongylus tenuis]|uniref:Uncharacterized protein n=1 Tax=Parelaphostrongylus tenuis TaxID=148309 RepID=A0AAD5R0X0_PARTN|nr:hypothetical protein KIN20_028499 [Parelaphostrongylus tenuis]
MAISNGVHVVELPDVSDLVCRYSVNEGSKLSQCCNVDEDFKLFLARWQVENVIIVTTSVRRPAALSGYCGTAELVHRPSSHQYMAGRAKQNRYNLWELRFQQFLPYRAH